MILRKHGNFYNISRRKACPCAYLRILACLCFCNFSGFPSALLCAAAGMCLFLFPAAKQATCNRKGKGFFRTALAIPQLEVYIIGSSLPEKWDRRILTFFSVSYNRNLEHFYNTDRSKACQNAYPRILACLCLRCCGLSKCLVIRRQGCAFFYFLPQNKQHVTGKEKFFSYGACNLATGSLYYRQLPPGEMGSEDFDVFFGMVS